MRTKFYFGAFAALALGLASCASDEPTVDPGSSTGGERYMAVTIQTIGDDTRALPEDTEFENGVGNENVITKENIRFYFFTATGAPFTMSHVNVGGTVTNTNMLEPTELATVETTNGGVTTSEIKGVLVLGTPEGYVGNIPAKVVAVANRKNLNFEDLANIPLSDVQNKVSTVPTANFDTSSFTMSSSSYVDGGQVVCYTDVTDKIKDTADAAKNDPAVIYLERIASKVRVQGLGEYTVKKRNADGTLTDENFTIWSSDAVPTPTTLTVELQGWQLLNKAHTTHVLKNISSFVDNPPYADWNDPTRHRSYWAFTSASEKTDFTNTAYKLYGADADYYFKLGNYDAAAPTSNVDYTFGNTRFADTDAATKNTMATAILVKAQVKDSDGNPVELVKWNSEYFTLDQFKKVVINAYNTQSGQSLDASVVSLKSLGKNLWVATVNDTEFARFTNISWWQNGITTYRANILHYADGAKTLYGVVRNHIYDYTFNNVIGLGIPGEEPVDPEPETESYLAAVVRVLNWHLVTRTVTLGE